MRQKHETVKSFNELKEITQIMQAQKRSEPTSANAKISEITHKPALKPKSSAQAKKGALKPTKKAFSERQNTAFRDNSQAIAKTSFKTKASHNANAFKTEQANNNFKPGLAKHQENQKGGNNEA
ncbi:hypothetical protein ACOWME_06740 [Helicobacter pylori]